MPRPQSARSHAPPPKKKAHDAMNMRAHPKAYGADGGEDSKAPFAPQTASGGTQRKTIATKPTSPTRPNSPRIARHDLARHNLIRTRPRPMRPRAPPERIPKRTTPKRFTTPRKRPDVSRETFVRSVLAIVTLNPHTC